MTLAPPPDDSRLSASALTRVDITYRLPDRFGVDRDELVHVDHITADVSGVLTGAGAAQRRHVAVGEFTFGRVDLLRAGDETAALLDAHSGEWEGYIPLVDAAGANLPRFLLILDRLVIAPWARGHALGLHVAARAIRSWGDDALVVMTAFPLDGPPDDRHAGASALSRYWQRLGLDEITGSAPPLLRGWSNCDRVATTLAALSDWQPPTTPR